jgi:hypothetical protein
MGYQNALLCATEYRRCESQLTGVEPLLGVTPPAIPSPALHGVVQKLHRALVG